MRFYQECVKVAKSVGALLTEEQMGRFVQGDVAAMSEYRHVLGMWIGHHLLPHNLYLPDALSLLGMETTEEQLRYLIAFSQQYWLLSRANMM